MKKIAVATTSRADFGILEPVLRAIADASDFDLQLVVSGSHLSHSHGHTIDEIRARGFEPAATVDCPMDDDEPCAIARAMGTVTIGMADVLDELEPDALVVLGDRFEMHALAVAATPFAIPLVHIHGGEVTEGAVDDSLRHSLTKLSHLHFVSTEVYRRRLLQLGEEPWRVVVSGAPALDRLDERTVWDRRMLAQQLGIALPDDFLLVTLHPVTRAYDRAAEHARSLVAALEDVGIAALVTAANADTHGSRINAVLRELAGRRDDVWFVESLGAVAYFSAMASASAMVGNSSSGIIEAASFSLPVVNVGPRQAGRVRGENVIDVEHDAASIAAGIRRALSPDFRALATRAENPYVVGSAAQTIVETLREKLQNPRLWHKRFRDLPEQP